MTLKERTMTIANEQMLMREQHGRARARLSDILEVLDRESDIDRADLAGRTNWVNEIADLARAGLKEK